MARKFQIKRGLRESIPELAQGELAMTTDAGSEGLFIGTGTGTNIEFARKSDLEAAGGAFIATYDTTSLADILEAINAGKTVMAAGPDGDYTGYGILVESNATEVLFAKPEYENILFLRCNSEGWSAWNSMYKDAAFLGENITGGSANDTPSFWVEKGPGYCWISELDQVVNQPTQHGFIINYVSSGDVFQIYRDQHYAVTYFRSGDAINDWFQHWTAVYDEAHGPVTSDGTVTSENADYAEVGEWADGNTANEDRIGYFVAIDTSSAGRTMVKATSTADARGVTVTAPAFAGGYSADKVGEDGNLLAKYDFVAVMGIVSVIDNGTCTVNERCMPGDDGTAVPSTNNLGYHVMERVDDTHVLIAVEPGADMIQRIKTDVSELQSGKAPAGYGLGEEWAKVATSMSDFTGAGFYKMPNDSGIAPDTSSNWWAICFGGTNKYKTVLAIRSGKSFVYKSCAGETWDTEWKELGLSIKQASITLSTDWTGDASPYAQAVTISGTTSNSKVDLQPDATAIQHMADDGTVALYIANNNGTLTAYAVGEKPTSALTIQATITEVSA